MSNCQKCNVHNELSNDKNYSDEVAIWTELDIQMPKDYYSLCKLGYYLEETKDKTLKNINDIQYNIELI